MKTCVWKEYVESCESQGQVQQRLLDTTETYYEADLQALNNITIAGTLVQAKKQGPIVTPKQFPCSYCVVGACTVVVNVVQCNCGTNQCPPVAATTTPQPRNPCAINPCLNGGQCAPNGPGFICNCPATFTGNRCEAPAATPCQPNPCLNGGICHVQGSTFICQCPSTFTGRCCEIRVTTTTPFNPCALSQCQNNARCVPTGSSFLCECPPGYYGTRCELRNFCIPNPCDNGGQCQQTTTGYICRCSYPYTGTNCREIMTTTTTTTTTTAVATRAPCGTNCACVVNPCPTVVIYNPCVPNPCQNMGGCAVQSNAALCYCPNLYYGYYCQMRRSGRSLATKACNKTCLNGGQCYLDETNGDQPRCSCPYEFYGSRCEFKNGPKSCSPKNPCMNKGQCVTTKTGAQCVCAKGTSGVLCEKVERAKNARYCPLECQAGGTCVYVGNTARCRCPKNRTGRLCETSA